MVSFQRHCLTLVLCVGCGRIGYQTSHGLDAEAQDGGDRNGIADATPRDSASFDATVLDAARQDATLDGPADAGPPGPIDPPPVTDGLLIWLDAQQSHTFDLVGSEVRAWFDAFGSGDAVSQSDTGARPSLVDNALNGHPVVRFDGVDDILGANGNGRFDIARPTIFVVATPRYDTTPTNTSFFSIYQGGTTTLFSLHLSPDRSQYFLWNGASGLGVLTVFEQGVARVFGCRWPGSTELYLDGQPRASGDSPPQDVPEPGVLYVGGKYPTDIASPELFPGDVAEVLYYDHTLSSPEMEAVSAYLAGQWGI